MLLLLDRSLQDKCLEGEFDGFSGGALGIISRQMIS